MGTPYFPGCTLSTKAKNFDQSGRAVAEALGMPLDELPDWQCCGASFPLATDNSMALIGPTRVLIQAEQQGDRVATLCAICYNVLKRTAVTLKQHPEQQEPDDQSESQRHRGLNDAPDSARSFGLNRTRQTRPAPNTQTEEADECSDKSGDG